MKLLLSLFMILALESCFNNRYDKPFVVTGKEKVHSEWRYEYHTANSNFDYFYELTEKYNIGDTIR